MTAKLFVSSKNVRALVSVQDIRVADVALQKSTIQVDETVLRAIASYVSVNPSISYARIVGLMASANTVVADLRLEPDSLNRYLQDALSLADDAPTLTVGKALVDSLQAIEDATLAVGKGLADTALLSEAASVFTNLAKSDALSVSESRSFALSTARTDSLLTSEALALGFGKSEADSVSASEQSSTEVGLGKADTATVSESFARVVTFIRSFTDSVSVDDNATVDAFVKETQANKTNVAFVSETLSLDLGSSLSDSMALTDVPTLDMAVFFSDSPVVTESIQISLISAASSVLNASALNVSTLNN